MEDSFEYIAMMKIQMFELLLRCHFSFEAKELVSWRGKYSAVFFYIQQIHDIYIYKVFHV